MGMQLLLDSAVSNGAMLGIIPAVPSGFVYANLFGDPAARPDRNLVPGRPAGKLVGSVFPNGTFVTLDYYNYIDLGVVETDAMTFMMVGGITPDQVPSGKFGYFLGSYTGTNTGFNVLVPHYSANIIEAYVGRSANGADVGEETGGVNSNAFLATCFRASSDYATRVDNLTAQASNQNPVRPVKPRVVIGNPLMLGRSPLVSPGFFGSVNLVAAMLWTRVLSDAEMAAAYAQMKRLLADQGVNV